MAAKQFFNNDFFLVSVGVNSATTDLIRRHGGTVLYVHDARVTYAVTVTCVHSCGTSASTLPSLRLLRAMRVPIVKEIGLHLYAEEQQQHNTNNSVSDMYHFCRQGGMIVYDPFVFRGWMFTTTQLPRSIKRNVIAAMQFYGARYSPDLTADTNLLIYSNVLSSIARPAKVDQAGATPVTHMDESRSGATGSPSHTAMSSSSSNEMLCSLSKLTVARGRGVVVCVTPSWVQACLGSNCILPWNDTTNQDSTSQATAHVVAVQASPTFGAVAAAHSHTTCARGDDPLLDATIACTQGERPTATRTTTPVSVTGQQAFPVQMTTGTYTSNEKVGQEEEQARLDCWEDATAVEHWTAEKSLVGEEEREGLHGNDQRVGVRRVREQTWATTSRKHRGAFAAVTSCRALQVSPYAAALSAITDAAADAHRRTPRRHDGVRRKLCLL